MAVVCVQVGIGRLLEEYLVGGSRSKWKRLSLWLSFAQVYTEILRKSSIDINATSKNMFIGILMHVLLLWRRINKPDCVRI